MLNEKSKAKEYDVTWMEITDGDVDTAVMRTERVTAESENDAVSLVIELIDENFRRNYIEVCADVVETYINGTVTEYSGFTAESVTA